MKRTTPSQKVGIIGNEKRFSVLQQVITDVLSRTSIAYRMGHSYGSDRKIYDALGYPDEDNDLNFQWFWNKYIRDPIASAIIDRPVDATWNGELLITEEGKTPEESPLAKAWEELNEEYKLKKHLNHVDKLAGIGQFALLWFGFNDVRKVEDFKRPVGRGPKKLLYLRTVSEGDVEIHEWEKNSSNPRYGLPKVYKISTGSKDRAATTTKEVLVHFSRVLHIKTDSVGSTVYGRPRLKPIANRLVDLEKLLGGDAEMFWRGARPGYQTDVADGYQITDKEREKLYDQLDKFEHDLRRIFSMEGVKLEALTPQISDPQNHIDVQLQAISAQTGIPKRILVGSERGELSSSQDKDQWLSLIQTRMKDYAEPEILRPCVDKLMIHGLLPKVKKYNVLWEDVFAPSEEAKVKVGKDRAAALKAYGDSVFATEILPPPLAAKILLGLTEEQQQEVMDAIEKQMKEEEKRMREELEEEGSQRGNGTGTLADAELEEIEEQN